MVLGSSMNSTSSICLRTSDTARASTFTLSRLSLIAPPCTCAPVRFSPCGTSPDNSRRCCASRPSTLPGHPGSVLGRDAQHRRELSGDVPQGEKRTGAQVQGGAMRLSRDKVNVLARAVSDVLKQMDEVEFIEDPNTIRQETRKILEDLLNQEERIDVAARQKIDSQKRTILEGSQEWDILYRKYYNEEVKKLGV